MCRTPDASLVDTSITRSDLVCSLNSEHSSHHSDSDHRIPDIEVSDEHILSATTTGLVSDVMGGMRFAPSTTVNSDGNFPGSGEKVDIDSPDYASSAVSGVSISNEANFVVSVKEKLLSSSSQKPLSTRSTPTGSRSPSNRPSPPRSVTPDSKRHPVPAGTRSYREQAVEKEKASGNKPKRGSASPSKLLSPKHADSAATKPVLTNPFDSLSSQDSMSSVNSSTGLPGQVKEAGGEAAKRGGGEEVKDHFAIANAVAISNVSAKLSGSGKPSLTEQEKNMIALAKAVAVSEASSKLSELRSTNASPDKKPSSSSTTAVAAKVPERKGSGKKKTAPSKVPQKIFEKPRLDSMFLSSFFRGIVAHDQGEVMMNVTWGGCSLPSSPVCDVEVGLITSDRAVYLLEVLNPEYHVKRQLSWTSENLPLAKIMAIPISTLSKVTLGLLDQIIQAEFISKGIVKKFAVVPYHHEDLKAFVANLKAVLEASGIKYFVTSPQELILSPPEVTDSVIFLNPDLSDFTRLKESIVHPKTAVQVGNYIASSSGDKNILNVSINEETRRVTDDICSKFEIEQYVMVAEISTDYLPIANSKIHLRSRVLILTNDTIYLCKEDFSMHPNDTSYSFNPPFPRCIVLDSHPLICATDVLICERPQQVVSYTDPVFEFSISFEVVNNVPSSAKTTFQWELCAQNKKRIEQFVSSLNRQLEMSDMTGLRISRTVDSISPVLRLPDTSRSKKKSTVSPTKSVSMKSSSGSSNKLSPIQPSFFHSEMLINFSRLTNFQRLKFFKKFIAQAEFLKSDEVPLSVFLSHCSTSTKDDATEVEACVLTSNYAIYLLSDLENIQAWLNGGGPISFQARALTSKKDANHLRCFYRVWLTDIKEITVGLFYLSVFITECLKEKGSRTFVIHTNIPSATLSLLSALSVSVDLRDSAEEEELSDLLSDYIDLAAESASKQSRPLVRPTVEFIQQHDLDVDKLKQMLLGIGPKISRSYSIEESAATVQIFCQQVMLLIEDIRIRDSVCLKSIPHLVLLTNYGLFVCKNSNYDQLSPSVASPSDLQVRKWCHIDLVDSVKVTSPETSIYGEHMLSIQVRSQNNPMERNMLCFLVQNSELLNHFLHFLCHIWQVRSSRQLPIQWE